MPKTKYARDRWEYPRMPVVPARIRRRRFALTIALSAIFFAGAALAAGAGNQAAHPSDDSTVAVATDTTTTDVTTTTDAATTAADTTTGPTAGRPACDPVSRARLRPAAVAERQPGDSDGAGRGRDRDELPRRPVQVGRCGARDRVRLLGSRALRLRAAWDQPRPLC